MLSFDSLIEIHQGIVGLSVWHGDLHKRKASGGRKRAYRMKRRFERGSFPTEATLGELKRKASRRRGGNMKHRILSVTFANVSDPSTGKTEKAEIFRVVRTPANVDYDRRGVITKGAIIETPLGTARVTSRPGQNGLVNAILIPKGA
ncbi:MAG: 30S ribosomal protein S8e [Candidatus Bathyarchaeota archaeon BA1]|nr:MAG: 30S ribosomal protein S8e [Candidatus Bathyarchaeota archaeon BA1]